MSKPVRSHAKRRLFLAEIEKGFSESRAAKVAGESVRFFTRWRDEDENFKLDWEDADRAGLHKLEDVARNRAVKKSDALLVTLLKAKDPKKYRENTSVEHTGKVDVSGATERLRAKIAKAIAEAEGDRTAD